MEPIKMGQDDKYQMRNGRSVRILAVDLEGPYPVAAVCVPQWSQYVVERFTSTGQLQQGQSSNLDIILKPQPFKYERWVNVYEQGPSHPYTSRWYADDCATKERIACVKITIEGNEGDGL